MNFAEYIPTISLVLGLAIAIIELRKGPSEAEARVTDSAVKTLDRVTNRLDDVEKELEELRAREKERDTREAELLRGVWILIRQLEAAQIVPQWHPPVYPADVLGQHSRDRGDLPKQQPTEKVQDGSSKNPKRRGF